MFPKASLRAGSPFSCHCSRSQVPHNPSQKAVQSHLSVLPPSSSLRSETVYAYYSGPPRQGKPAEPSEGGTPAASRRAYRTSPGPGPRPTALPPHPAAAPGRGAAGAEQERRAQHGSGRPSPRSPRHTNSTDFASPAAIFAQGTSRLSRRARLVLRHRLV